MCIRRKYGRNAAATSGVKGSGKMPVTTAMMGTAVKTGVVKAAQRYDHVPAVYSSLCRGERPSCSRGHSLLRSACSQPNKPFNGNGFSGVSS